MSKTDKYIKMQPNGCATIPLLCSAKHVHTTLERFCVCRTVTTVTTVTAATVAVTVTVTTVTATSVTAEVTTAKKKRAPVAMFLNDIYFHT